MGAAGEGRATCGRQRQIVVIAVVEARHAAVVAVLLAVAFAEEALLVVAAAEEAVLVVVAAEEAKLVVVVVAAAGARLVAVAVELLLKYKKIDGHGTRKNHFKNKNGEKKIKMRR